MVKERRALIAAVALMAVAAFLLWPKSEPPVATTAGASAPAKAAEDVPWIQLDRLKSPNPSVQLGMRNIFTYGPNPTPVPPPPVAVIETPAPPVGVPPTLEANGVPPTPAPQPLTLKFLGIAQPDGGAKIALLQTEQKEILHGREGDTLAGRYRIGKIGLESVEIEEVTTGQKQTIRIGGR